MLCKVFHTHSSAEYLDLGLNRCDYVNISYHNEIELNAEDDP